MDLFKTMELLNKLCILYAGGTPPLSVNAFCIVTNSAHETPVYPRSVPRYYHYLYGAPHG